MVLMYIFENYLKQSSLYLVSSLTATTAVLIG